MGLPGHRRPVGDAVGAWVYRWWCISAMTGAQDAQVTARVGYSRREPTPTNGAVTWVSSSKCDVHTPAPQVVHTPTAAEARLSVEQSKQFIMYSFSGWVSRRQKSRNGRSSAATQKVWPDEAPRKCPHLNGFRMAVNRKRWRHSRSGPSEGVLPGGAPAVAEVSRGCPPGWREANQRVGSPLAEGVYGSADMVTSSTGRLRMRITRRWG